MAELPPFDPFQVLGVEPDADEVVIQLAYRARIREAHPDVAGAAGLEISKRLNVARDWLLDPDRRARLGHPRASGSPQAGPESAAPGGPRRRRHARTRRVFDPQDLGPRTAEIHAFLASIGSLSPDERARVNYSLGDAPPPDLEGYRIYLDPDLWSRSQALRDEVERVWEYGYDEPAPDVPGLGRLLPTGLLVANLYAQWILLESFFREELSGLAVRGVRVADTLALRCTAPWISSIGQRRYGPRQDEVMAFFMAAGELSIDAAERLAQSWRLHLGKDGRGRRSESIGPGVWLPSPPDVPGVYLTSGYLAAVDASRLVPPPGLHASLLPAFYYGVRLTAYVSATGLLDERGRDYVRPWRDAVMPEMR